MHCELLRGRSRWAHPLERGGVHSSFVLRNPLEFGHFRFGLACGAIRAVTGGQRGGGSGGFNLMQQTHTDTNAQCRPMQQRHLVKPRAALPAPNGAAVRCGPLTFALSSLNSFSSDSAAASLASRTPTSATAYTK